MEIEGLYQKTAAEEEDEIIKFKSPMTEGLEKAMPNSKERMKKGTNLIPLAFVILILIAVVGSLVYFL